MNLQCIVNHNFIECECRNKGLYLGHIFKIPKSIKYSYILVIKLVTVNVLQVKCHRSVHLLMIYKGWSVSIQTFCFFLKKHFLNFFFKNYFYSFLTYSPPTSIFFCHLHGSICIPSANHEVDYCEVAIYSWNQSHHSLRLIVLGFNDTSTLVGHFVSSPREKEERDSRGDEREGHGRKRNRNESEETEEMKKKKHSPSTLAYYKDNRPCQTGSQYQLDALAM